MAYAALPPARGLILPPGRPFSQQTGPAPRHPLPETLERFATGMASRAECREVVAHLLKRCPACAASCRKRFDPVVAPEPYDEVLDRTFAAVRRSVWKA